MCAGLIPDEVFEPQERELFLSAEEMPGMVVGHKARMALAHLVAEVSEDDQLPKRGLVDLSADGDSTLLRKFAVASLGVIALRAIGSARCLVACGYVPEAKAPIRRLTEASIRTKAIADDPSGDHARAWLAGRPLGSPARLHRRYGSSGDFAGFYSRQAHAGMDSLGDHFRLDDNEDLYVMAIPHRDEMAIKVAGLLMKAAGAQVLMLAHALVDTFDRLLSEGTADELNEVCVLLGVGEIFTRTAER